jgi:hypothetical protein
MGKKSKEHRVKVAKRNAKIKQQKSGMQKTFDILLQEQTKKLKNDEMKVEIQGNDINYEVVEHKTIDHAFKFTPNEEESAKINKEFEPEYDSVEYTIEDREIDVDTDMAGEFVKYEEVRNIFPANAEGLKEFNQANTEQ